ncbi:MAG TPA: hypothetical protein VFV52_00810 [Bacilli bacterium]|nr:hypothetical protein [Bacilli bacterium]
MIKVTLYEDSLGTLDEDKSLDPFRQSLATKYQAKMNEEEFDEFLKANNLITYRHHLKRYHDGVVCGEFTLS